MNILPVFLLLLAAGLTQPAQTGIQHSASRTPQSALEHVFRLADPAEVALAMRASAPGTSWREPGAEAAVVGLELDGKYNQHVTLWMGAATHEYRLLLGPVGAGRHRLRAQLDRALSAPAARSFQAEFRIQPFERGATEYAALRRAPIVYARPDTVGRASDAPLLAYYEWLPAPPEAPAGATRMLQYTYIFTNEDEGTDTTALMARWGRTVDIEYVYRVLLDRAGNAVAETFQGANHKETPFRGGKVGLHPLLYVASKNNIFSDQPPGGEGSQRGDGSGQAGRPAPTPQMRVALWPEPADLTDHSREELLDRHPWAYRLMAEELEREGRLKEIADPRQFLYVEARIATLDSGASFAVALKDGRTFHSDRNRAELRIERNGWVRTAIELPSRTAFEEIGHLLFHCDPPAKLPARREAAPEPFCAVEAISKIFFLDEDYRPVSSRPITRGLPARITTGDSARF